MIDVLPFDPTLHTDEVNSWWRAWGLRELPPGWLPRGGFIVPGVATAFVYLTDSRVAFIECVIANPESLEEVRSEALDAIGHACIHYARAMGAHYLVGHSPISTIVERAVSQGYSVSPREMRQIVRPLQEVPT